MSRKLIVNDGRGERELLLVGKMVVGRDPACDVSDADPLLSRRHAEFIVGARDVVVRDLGSRNGILINGIKVSEGALRPGDIVQVGHLQLRYLEDGAPLAAAADPAADDATAVIQQAPPFAPPARYQMPASAPRQPPLADEGDKTRLVAPPTAPHRAASAAQPAPMPASYPAAPPDEDKTRLVSAPAYYPPAQPASASAAPRAAASPHAAAARPATRARSAAQPTAGEPDRTARVAKRPWTIFVLIQVTGLAAIVFVSVAIPMMIWQSKVLNATATSSASALANWLAADASVALQSGRSVADAADAVGREAGVVSAFVLSPDGHVLAPASRATETVAVIPAIGGSGAKPDDVRRLQWAWNGDLVEVVRPVQAKDRPRAAIAWITFRPTAPPEAGNGAVVLAVPVIIVLIATYVVATLISRRTMRGLTALNEDIELALGGKLDAVGDPLGAKPIRDLSDAVNYLIARLRGATDGQGATPDLGYSRPMPAAAASPAAGRAPAYGVAPSRPAPAPRQAAPASPAPPPAPVEARMVASTQFRVTEASPGCADLLGVRPDALVGQHLIDAIPDQQITDAIMQCLSTLPAQGEQRASAAPAGRHKLSIVMARAGKDQPITITFRADRAGQTA